MLTTVANIKFKQIHSFFRLFPHVTKCSLTFIFIYSVHSCCFLCFWCFNSLNITFKLKPQYFSHLDKEMLVIFYFQFILLLLFYRYPKLHVQGHIQTFLSLLFIMSEYIFILKIFPEYVCIKSTEGRRIIKMRAIFPFKFIIYDCLLTFSVQKK